MAIGKDNTRVIVTISKELKERAEKKAKSENRPLSNYIVYLIQKDLNNGKTNTD